MSIYIAHNRTAPLMLYCMGVFCLTVIKADCWVLTEVWLRSAECTSSYCVRAVLIVSNVGADFGFELPEHSSSGM